MSKIRVKAARAKRTEPAEDRRAVDDVLGFQSSASAAGSTTWKRMRKCPREHALYHLGIRGKKPKQALDIGLLVHHALEAYYRHIHTYQLDFGKVDRDDPRMLADFCFGAVTDAEHVAWESIVAFASEPGYSEDYAVIERCLRAYFEQYRRADYWRIVAVEETLEFEDAGLHYTARLDLLIERLDDAGGIWNVEHKTAGFLTDGLLSNYQMDMQVLGQNWLLRTCVDWDRMPARYHGTIINVVTTRNNPPRLHRHEVMPSQRHLFAFEKAQREWQVVARTFEALGWPKALGNCAGYERFQKHCVYYDLCHGSPQNDMAAWRAEVEKSGAPPGYVLVGDPRALPQGDDE